MRREWRRGGKGGEGEGEGRRGGEREYMIPTQEGLSCSEESSVLIGADVWAEGL